jgi:hypothetical protein
MTGLPAEVHKTGSKAVETRVPTLKQKNNMDKRVPKYWVTGVRDSTYKNRDKTQ